MTSEISKPEKKKPHLEQDGLAGPSTVRTTETIPLPLEDGEDGDGGIGCFQVPLLEMKGHSLFLHIVCDFVCLLSVVLQTSPRMRSQIRLGTQLSRQHGDKLIHSNPIHSQM